MEHTNAEQTQQCEVVSESTYFAKTENLQEYNALPESAKTLLKLQSDLQNLLVETVANIFKKRINELNKSEIDASIHVMD